MSDADMWALAQDNADVLRMSTLFTAQQVPKYLSDNEGIEQAIEWCKRHGVTHVYLESFRTGAVPLSDVLVRACDRFRDAGLLVSGCITPAGYGKRSKEWSLLSCYTAEETLSQLKEMAQYAARLFEEVMIDDFFATNCGCADCLVARGQRSWAEFRCELMLRVSRTCILEPARTINPNVRFIIKYPCWHELFQERGYDVAGQTDLFPMTWVGTETRGKEETGADEPQYRAYWLMRWLLGIGGAKCGGGWYDTIGTSPSYYLEQARQTILGGASELFLFNFGALHEGTSYDQGWGPQDADALLAELPLHFELARLIHGRPARGLLGWKPAGSPPGEDWNLHILLGMAGFPVTAAHEFDPAAPGFVFGCHVLHDAGWPEALEQALESGRPIVVTPAFLEAVRAQGRGPQASELAERAVVVPRLSDRNRWEAVEQMPRAGLDALRGRALEGLGLTVSAPPGVALYLFGEDVIVLENFRDEQVVCELRLEGSDGFELAVQMPADRPVAVAWGPTVALDLPSRSLLALTRKNRDRHHFPGS